MLFSTIVLSLLLSISESSARFTQSRSHHDIQPNPNKKLTLGFAHAVKALATPGSKNLAQIDRERAVAFLGGSSGLSKAGKVVSVGATNTAVTYSTTVGIGSPPVQCEQRKTLTSFDVYESLRYLVDRHW